MSTGLLFAIVVLGAAFLVLAYVVVRGEGTLLQMLSFVLLLGVVAALGYIFVVYVVGRNPNPARVAAATLLSEDKVINLATVVPGVPDPLNYVYRLDTDFATEDEGERATDNKEWLVFYRYDTVGQGTGGPFGGAIYDYDRCRPPNIHSFELVPVNYDYLGEESVRVEVKNIIKYDDPLSLDRNAMEMDRPEVIIKGVSRGVVTDLNIFRKVGGDEECVSRRTVQFVPIPQQTVTIPFSYDNIGCFRGTDRVDLGDDATVVVKDRAGFERSQIVIRRVYTPKNGSYFTPERPEDEPGPSRQLLPPDEVGLAFGPGRPDETRKVYYPEKAVLAFLLELGPHPDEAMSYTCQGKGTSAYDPARFGLTKPLDELKDIVVCELRYNPDAVGEQNHDTQYVKASVVEVGEGGLKSCAWARTIECEVASAPNPGALPYGCEWCILQCCVGECPDKVP